MEMSVAAYRFVEMIVKFFSGTINDEELEIFTSILRSNPKARQYYIEAALLESMLNGRRSLCSELSTYLYEPVLDPRFWEALSDQERRADAIEIEKVECESNKALDSANSLNYVRQTRKLALMWIIISTAAVVFFVLYARFVPPKADDIVAFVASQSKDAKWSHTTGAVRDNQPLYAGPMRLLSGFAEVRLESGATIMIEGPADFALEKNDQVYLGNGRLTASVSPSAIGFTVRTPNASVVDYGTEFGVLVWEGGWTETHVFQGEVEIRQGSNVRVFETAQRLSAGQAALARHDGIHRIENRPQSFIANMPTVYDMGINSLKPLLVWRHSQHGFRHFMDTAITPSVKIVGEEIGFEKIHGIPGLYGFQSLRMNGNNLCQMHVLSDESGHSDSDGFSHIFWFKADSVTEQDLLVDVVRREDYEWYRMISIDQDGRIVHSMRRTDRSGRNISIKSQRVIEAGQWYQVALVGVRHTKSLYINGRLEGHEDLVSPYRLTSSMFYLGGTPLLENEDQYPGFYGQIGELIGFDRALSHEEIMRLYEAAYASVR